MRMVRFTDALEQVTTLCIVCLRQGGETDHDVIKDKVLAAARLALTSERLAPAPVNVAEVDEDGNVEMGPARWGTNAGIFRSVLMQHDERRQPKFQEQVLAQVAWLVDQLWDRPDIVEASDSGRPVVISGR